MPSVSLFESLAPVLLIMQIAYLRVILVIVSFNEINGIKLMIRSIIRSLLRPAWHKTAGMRQWIQLLKIYLYDYKRYSRFYVNATSKKTGKEELTGWILQDKHRVEKGLSLPQVRIHFGESVLKRLYGNLERYREQFGKDNVYFWGVGAFRAYADFHNQLGENNKDWFKQLYGSFSSDDLENVVAQSVGIVASEKSQITSSDFQQFFNSRSSTRCFQKGKLIDANVLRSITNIAIKTPSVCNRQHWKVHIISGQLKKRVLELQNGNVGFGDDVPQVAIITSSLKAFYLPAERVQAFTDGGMFAMSFMLSCHAHGVASCALNWAASLEQDIKIRKLDILDEDEAVIMLIALGYEKEDAFVAKSPRKSVDEILKLES